MNLVHKTIDMRSQRLPYFKADSIIITEMKNIFLHLSIEQHYSTDLSNEYLRFQLCIF